MDPDLPALLDTDVDGDLRPEVLATLGPDIGNYLTAAAILSTLPPLGEVPNVARRRGRRSEASDKGVGPAPARRPRHRRGRRDGPSCTPPSWPALKAAERSCPQAGPARDGDGRHVIAPGRRASEERHAGEGTAAASMRVDDVRGRPSRQVARSLRCVGHHSTGWNRRRRNVACRKFSLTTERTFGKMDA